MPARIILGTQWGDEGKGKLVDLLSEDADAVVRYQGGNNAGHTVVVDGTRYIFHTVPSGVLRPNVHNIIAGGVVLNPEQGREEIETLRNAGAQISPKNLHISYNAHIITPVDLALDFATSGAIGTTNRGIGPTYTRRAERTGIRVSDLYYVQNVPGIRQEILRNLGPYCWETRNKLEEEMLRSKNEPEKVAKIQRMINNISDPEAVLAHLERNFESLKPYVTDTREIVDRLMSDGKVVLFESAQGTMLDVDEGTYPYVTSSNTTAGAVFTAGGLSPKYASEIIDVIGVAKAYTTRVGRGPFPTELNDETGKRIREKGQEFGATTGRPRRCGWRDDVVLDHSAKINGITRLAITKIDVLDDEEYIRVCGSYRLNGDTLTDMPEHTALIGKCEPVYYKMRGWQQPTTNARYMSDLPEDAKKYVEDFEKKLGINVGWVSVGSKREQTISIR